MSKAVDPMLLEQRDFVYREFLQLPLDSRGVRIWLVPMAQANFLPFP